MATVNKKTSIASIDSIIGGPIGAAAKLGIKAGVTLSGAVALLHSDGSYIQPSITADGKVALSRVLEGMVIDAPAFVLPIPANQVKRNDIILKDNDLLLVSGFTEDGTIAAVSIERSEKIDVVPVTHQLIPGAFVRKLSSLLGTVGDTSGASPFAPQGGLGGQQAGAANLLPLLMMSKGGKGGDMSNLLMLSALGGGGAAAGGGLGNIAQNPMMMMAMMGGDNGLDLGSGDGENGLMHALMMQSLIAPQAVATAPVATPANIQVATLTAQVETLTQLVNSLVGVAKETKTK